MCMHKTQIWMRRSLGPFKSSSIFKQLILLPLHHHSWRLVTARRRLSPSRLCPPRVGSAIVSSASRLGFVVVLLRFVSDHHWRWSQYLHSLNRGPLNSLHLYCASCRETKCRGCLVPVDCDPNCSGAHDTCRILRHCSAVRVIALYEVLQCFDSHYLKVTKSVVSDGCHQRQTLTASLLRCIHDPARSWTKDLSSILGWLMTVLTAARDARPSWTDADDAHDVLQEVIESLFKQSFLMEFFQHILITSYETKDWLSHHQFFLLVLRVMNFLSTSGFISLFTDAHQRTRWSDGLRSRLLDEAFLWEEDPNERRCSLFSNMHPFQKGLLRLQSSERHAQPGGVVQTKLSDITHEMGFLLVQSMGY